MGSTFVVITVPINAGKTANYIQEDIIKQELRKQQTPIDDYHIDQSTIQIHSTSNGLYATMLAFKQK